MGSAQIADASIQPVRGKSHPLDSATPDQIGGIYITESSNFQPVANLLLPVRGS